MKRFALLFLIISVSACNLNSSVETPGAQPIGTPPPVFQSELGMGTTRVITIEAVNLIPANTRVRLSTATYVEGEWLYTIVVEGTEAYTTARESQLAWAPGEVPGAPTPTMRFSSDTSSIYRFITLENVGDIPANTRVRVEETRWEDNGWTYVIVAEDEHQRAEARESQLAAAPETPSASFFSGDIGNGYRFITLENVGDIPANTSVAIAQVDMRQNEWIYTITTQDGRRAEAHSWQIDYAPDITPGFVPTMMFSGAVGYGVLQVVTIEPLGEIPAGTKVSLNGATFDGREWLYTLQTTDGLMYEGARESQLRWAPGVTPNAPTPTAAFQGSGYILITLEQIGEIPAGTRVGIGSMYMQGGVWIYQITTQDGLYADAHASQLAYAPGVTPGAPTPTALFNSEFGMNVYRVVTLVQVGPIAAGTRVRVSSGYYDGFEWVYQIATEDGVFADASASQIAYAPGETPGMPTPTMTP